MNVHPPENLFPPAPKAFLVGGAVRDLVRGRPPVDYDVVVDGDPAVFADQLALRLNGRLVVLGKDHHTLYRVIGRKTCVDITAIKQGGIQSDLLSRDFTINALARRLDNPRVIDCTGGLEDLHRNTIRMVSARNLKGDPIRLLRAYRMESDLAFRIEPATLDTIARNALLIQTVPSERIWIEWRLLLNSETSYRQMSGLASTGLLDAIYPEIGALRHCTQNRHHDFDVFRHTLEAYRALEELLREPLGLIPSEAQPLIRELNDEARSVLKQAILLHDIGKPVRRIQDNEGNIHFHGHASQSAVMADWICSRLRTPNRFRKNVGFVIRNHQRPLSLFLGRSPKATGRFYRLCDEQTPLVILSAMADTLGQFQPLAPAAQAPLTAHLKELLLHYYRNARRDLREPALLNGHDLIRDFGLAPSPLFKKLLNDIEDARLAGLITQRQEALRWVERYLRRGI